MHNDHLIKIAKAVSDLLPCEWGFVVMVAPLHGQGTQLGHFSMTLPPNEALFHLEAAIRAIKGIEDGTNNDAEMRDFD